MPKRSGVWAIVAGHYKRVPTWWLSGMTLVDLDGDGDLDLIYVEGRDVVVYLNRPSGPLTRGPDVIGVKKLRIGPRSANWGGAVVTDFDNDGVADVIINGKYFLYVLRRRGGGKLELVNWRRE